MNRNILRKIPLPLPEHLNYTVLVVYLHSRLYFGLLDCAIWTVLKSVSSSMRLEEAGKLSLLGNRFNAKCRWFPREITTKIPSVKIAVYRPLNEWPQASAGVFSTKYSYPICQNGHRVKLNLLTWLLRLWTACAGLLSAKAFAALCPYCTSSTFQGRPNQEGLMHVQYNRRGLRSRSNVTLHTPRSRPVKTVNKDTCASHTWSSGTFESVPVVGRAQNP